MNDSDIWQALANAAPTLVSPEQLSRFQALYHAVVEANQRMNLTRITSEADFCTRHILDSLTLLPLLQGRSTPFRLADVGSGAGFPALIIAIMRPEVEVVAMESTQKKARFIEETAEKLSLPNVQVLAQRCEDLGQNALYREHFQAVVARAVAPLNILLELCLPLTAPDGAVYAMKTKKTLEEEVDQAQNAINVLGGKAIQVHEVSIETEPFDLPNRIILQIDKKAPTPKLYPRRAGTPEKTPL